MPDDDDREKPTPARTPSSLMRAAKFEVEVTKVRLAHEHKLALAGDTVPRDVVFTMLHDMERIIPVEWRYIIFELLSLIKPRCGLCASPATKKDDIVYRCDECAATMKSAVDLPHAAVIRRAITMTR